MASEAENSPDAQSEATTPFAQLEAPGASSTGLTGEERRAIFLDGEAFEGNADVQKNLREFGCDLSLIEFPEWQRTKHVHRLHPYLGKFIPQLVELFLRRFFRKGATVLDPFAGSGTTLVEANPLGIHAVGIELSAFNCRIIEAKTRRHDLRALGRDVDDAFRRVRDFTGRLDSDDELPLFRAAAASDRLCDPFGLHLPPLSGLTVSVTAVILPDSSQRVRRRTPFWREGKRPPCGRSRVSGGAHLGSYHGRAGNVPTAHTSC